MVIRDKQAVVGNLTEQAQVFGLQCLAFLAADEDRLSNLLLTTGLDLGSLKERASDPAFLGGVLDFLLSNEPLLLAFADEIRVQPQEIALARRRLPGHSDAS